jgi:hypothetical protein
MPGFNMFVGVMVFYAVLSYVVMPAVFYYFVEKNLVSAGNGFVVGSLFSVLLWYTFRSQII